MSIFTGPFNSAAEVTKSDTLPNIFDSLYVKTAGDGAASIVPFQGSATVAFTGLTAGTVIPVRTKLVLNIGTTVLIGMRF